MTRLEKLYLTKVAKLGCYCCRVDGNGEVPAQIHHIREGMGMGQRAKHIGETIPLCEAHHQGLVNTNCVAFHRGPRIWRNKYGSEREVAKAIYNLIQSLDETDPNWYY